MTDETIEPKRLFGPHYFGEQDETGIDLSLISENLKLTPLERMRKAECGPSAGAAAAGIWTKTARRWGFGRVGVDNHLDWFVKKKPRRSQDRLGSIRVQ